MLLKVQNPASLERGPYGVQGEMSVPANPIQKGSETLKRCKLNG